MQACRCDCQKSHEHQHACTYSNMFTRMFIHKMACFSCIFMCLLHKNIVMAEHHQVALLHTQTSTFLFLVCEQVLTLRKTRCVVSIGLCKVLMQRQIQERGSSRRVCSLLLAPIGVNSWGRVNPWEMDTGIRRRLLEEGIALHAVRQSHFKTGIVCVIKPVTLKLCVMISPPLGR